MSGFLGRYHDAVHVGVVVDLINCPFCQDAFVQEMFDAEEAERLMTTDRLEDLEV